LPKDEFYTPTDIDALRMENELLAFEVRFLKAQLAEPERSPKQLEERLARLERAETDLVLLLRRLANSPLGWFFRLWPGFQTLEQRYLTTNA
jgi:hypothetical protein